MYNISVTLTLKYKKYVNIYVILNERGKSMEHVETIKCLVELDEILKYLDKKELEKIPENIRNAINEKKDKEYKWKYDETKKLKEQNINRKTIAMLSYLNMEYLLNDEQRELMKQIHKNNEEKAEQRKSKKYNSDNIFKTTTEYSEIEETALVEVKHEKWYEKIVVFIKKIFKR